ncbi:ABC transporter substrate-binding protein [Pelomonas sp. V22]|uniref:ABC transporter substrate-binding protein n=1 Tax=Pelomonas sp. V22 TaxID=2822139 RepID=UPI0024A862F8|nr:helical backbone metal receptor [Pelomonas sp. V22]MDI4635154.1 ABC transporter substrate-binding protein [Pelomonas sp. V22]
MKHCSKIHLLLALLSGLLLTGGPARAADISLTDDLGRKQQWNESPRRIVSLLPSLTELVCALDACERLVGVDRYANFPASIAKLPKLGAMDDASVEAIVALRPDVVILSPASRLHDRLGALGVKTLVLDTLNLADVRRHIDTLSRLLESKSGPQIKENIERQLAAAAAQVPESMKGLRVYYEVDSAPYAAGEISFSGEILARLGLRNIVPAALGPFPKLNPEFVVRADPQLILVSQRNAQKLTDRPGWERIAALREQHVCRFTSAEGDLMARPGPRMGEGAQAVLRCLQELAAAKK